jgi:hypothetical protein
MVTNTDAKSLGHLAAAEHLERWADGLPRWSDDGRERWYEFLDRRYAAEVALIERLRRAPGCWITTCPMRLSVDITLGGIFVSTHKGLEAALREWVRRAREQGGP